ncbi:hypothetical protein NDU88_006524 [Pleurodeles waltl]|uniref:Uncharacterized protein n=1 Tax=Pleurodeles waltl TaxID=8319 RepID=A0AAV7SPX1_PLEWA|nr:hypothetical protein NDU88_006524 [Pleurodeles waltl]
MCGSLTCPPAGPRVLHQHWQEPNKTSLSHQIGPRCQGVGECAAKPSITTQPQQQTPQAQVLGATAQLCLATKPPTAASVGRLTRRLSPASSPPGRNPHSSGRELQRHRLPQSGERKRAKQHQAATGAPRSRPLPHCSNMTGTGSSDTSTVSQPPVPQGNPRHPRPLQPHDASSHRGRSPIEHPALVEVMAG